MKYFCMRIFFMMFRIQYILEYIMYYSTKPILEGIGNLMHRIPMVQRRLEKQGRTHEQVMKELNKSSYAYTFDIRTGWVTVYPSVGMGVFFAGIIVDVVMLPQLFISTPYYVRAMNDMPVLCISFLFAAGFFLSHILVIHDDIYIPYFKKFMKEPKRKEWSWHLISVVSIVLTILIFMYLTDYCFHME